MKAESLDSSYLTLPDGAGPFRGGGHPRGLRPQPGPDQRLRPPRIEQILGVTERVLDVPTRAVVGGLHLPVHAAGTPLVPQAVIGNPHPPWRPIGERDAEHVLEEIQARGPQLIALSGHDSTPWTFDAFARRFGDRYRTPSAAVMPNSHTGRRA